MNDLMKKKHLLRLTELEESVLIAQVKNLFDSFDITKIEIIKLTKNKEKSMTLIYNN